VIRYCLSSRIDPQGHATRIEYFDFDPAQVNTVVKRIVDPDDHALTFTYANLDLGGGYFKTNFIGQVTDWAGRTVKLGYDVNSLTLTQIVDAVNITNKLTYSFGTAWIQSLVTPYGATTFDHYQIRANHAETRYVTITGPNGAHQRYWYESADSTVPDPLDPLGDGNVVPSGTPFGDSFVLWVWDRNSYHWDARNYDALSTNFRNDPANNPPTSTDRLLGRGRHWMGTYDSFYGTVDTHTLGAERDTSPDGLVEGQLTWYNYEGKIDQDYQGTQILPAVM